MKRSLEFQRTESMEELPDSWHENSFPLSEADTTGENIKSDGQNSVVPRGLSRLITLFGQSGVDWAALIAQYLRDNREFLETVQGRALYREALRRISGTAWEDILLPKGQTPEEKRALKTLERSLFWPGDNE